MKLSDIRGEEALDALADLIDPMTEIFGDEEVVKSWRGGGKQIDIIKMILRKHKKSVLTALAILDGEDPKDYNPSMLSIPIKILALLNDPDVIALFPSQSPTSQEISSGRASGNTEGGEQ